MKETLISLLESFGLPVILQGTLASPADYPDDFFTFWNFANPEGEHYDNEANRCVWGFWVYFYSKDPVKVLNLTEQARRKLKANGFVSDGKPVDVRVDTPTHTGAMFTVYGVEQYTKEEST